MSNKDTLNEFIARLTGIDNTVDNLQPFAGEYVWKKLSSEGGTFIDYVVSGNADEYPDGGLLDGYWYEKLNVLSGIDCGIITLTESQETITVEHRLSQVPSIMALIPISGDAIASTTFLQVSGTSQFLDFYSLLSLYYDSNEASYEYNANIPLLEATETTATITARSTSYKFGAYTYLWVVR